MKLEKNNTGKNLNGIYIIVFIFSVTQLLIQLYLIRQEKLFNQVGMNLVHTLTNYNHLV